MPGSHDGPYLAAVPEALAAREPAPLAVLTSPPGGGALVRAALAGETPREWYAPVPHHAEEWRRHLDAVRGQFSAGAWLELLAPAFDATGAAADRLARSGGGAGVVVTTGQQPGLFGGPLYVLSKALSALALADALEAATGVPVAPVFWAATDDADFAEASRTRVAVGAEVRMLAAAPTAPDGMPMSHVPARRRRARLLDQLAARRGSSAHVQALDEARRAYGPGATVGGAYLALLRALLAPLGIAVLDASHAATREGGFNLLRRALLVSETLERETAARAADDRGRRVLAAGARRARSLARLRERRGRSQGARADVAGASAGLARGARHARDPNVLLRPVMERQIVPTVRTWPARASTRTSRR
jgi:hypothetical protein